MKNTKILLVSHIYSTNSGPVYGPYNVIKDYLNSKKANIQTIEYPLNSGMPLIFKSIAEIVGTIKKSLEFKPDVFIGIDPLNAFAGVVLRVLGLTGKTIFYCVDYTPTRFSNNFINSVYLGIDKFVSKKSDEVWNVSSRIVGVRKEQGVPENKIKFIPNSPVFKNCPKTPVGKINKNKIVMVAGLTHSPALEIVLKAFKDIAKKFPKTTLSIIGTGPYQERLITKVKLMGLASKIKFLGQLPNDKLLKEVSGSGLALAIYTYSKDFSWVYYGDSKKAREYLACGVPVVITDVVGTSLDIEEYGAGIVVAPTPQDISSAMEKMLSDRSLWTDMQKNAIKLAEDYDIYKILDRNFKSIL